LAARLGNPGKVGAKGFFRYGAASFGCTLPASLAVVSSGIAAGGVAQGAWRFVVYGLGMASVLVSLTLALAFFKWNLLTRLRKAVPYVQRASAALLVLEGAYVLYYWWMAVPS
jgi:cytochrome c-type biogenesis protein